MRRPSALCLSVFVSYDTQYRTYVIQSVLRLCDLFAIHFRSMCLGLALCLAFSLLSGRLHLGLLRLCRVLFRRVSVCTPSLLFLSLSHAISFALKRRISWLRFLADLRIRYPYK